MSLSKAAKRRPAATWAEIADTVAAEVEAAAAAMVAGRRRKIYFILFYV